MRNRFLLGAGVALAIAFGGAEAHAQMFGPFPPGAFYLGPEGGWTAEEESFFVAEKWLPVSLGPRILRAETAGIAAMAVIAAVVG